MKMGQGNFAAHEPLLCAKTFSFLPLNRFSVYLDLGWFYGQNQQNSSRYSFIHLRSALTQKACVAWLFLQQADIKVHTQNHCVCDWTSLF